MREMSACARKRECVCMCARKVTFTLSFCSSRMNGKTIKASNGQAGANPTKLSKQLCNAGNLLPPCRNLASILFWASLFSKRTIKGSSDLHTNHSLQVVLLRVLCRWIQGSIGAEWIAAEPSTNGPTGSNGSIFRTMESGIRIFFATKFFFHDSTVDSVVGVVDDVAVEVNVVVVVVDVMKLLVARSLLNFGRQISFTV